VGDSSSFAKPNDIVKLIRKTSLTKYVEMTPSDASHVAFCELSATSDGNAL
jgi:hypothetical protein